jgi:hypothetical protein
VPELTFLSYSWGPRRSNEVHTTKKTIDPWIAAIQQAPSKREEICILAFHHEAIMQCRCTKLFKSKHLPYCGLPNYASIALLLVSS